MTETMQLFVSLGRMGGVAAIALAAVGSALGAGVAGMAAVGAWKKCFAQDKPAPFMLAAFVGAPLTQTIYGLILMGRIDERAAELVEGVAVNATSFPLLIGAGVLGGLAMGASAMMQGKAAAGASDAFAETGKGFVNYLIALGIIETVALFVMVFLLLMI